MRTSRLISLSTLAFIVAAFAVAPGAQAADDYFLKIDGIAGETTVGSTKEAIQIRSFEWSADSPQSVGSASGGAGTGKAVLNELTVEKTVDSTSPALFQKLAQGAVIGGMELVARKAGTGASPIYMRYCVQPVFVTSQTHKGGGGDDAMQETLVFKYGAVSQQYSRQAPTGQVTSNVFASWNALTNTSSMQVPTGPNTCATSRF